jgi:hypothetical protein
MLQFIHHRGNVPICKFVEHTEQGFLLYVTIDELQLFW